MSKAIIIDDEMHCRKTLSLLLKEYCPDVQVMEQCSDVQAGAITSLQLINFSTNQLFNSSLSAIPRYLLSFAKYPIPSFKYTPALDLSRSLVYFYDSDQNSSNQ